jgi:hypothetical protein
MPLRSKRQRLDYYGRMTVCANLILRKYYAACPVLLFSTYNGKLIGYPTLKSLELDISDAYERGVRERLVVNRLHSRMVRRRW